LDISGGAWISSLFGLAAPEEMTAWWTWKRAVKSRSVYRLNTMAGARDQLLVKATIEWLCRNFNGRSVYGAPRFRSRYDMPADLSLYDQLLKSGTRQSRWHQEN